MERERGREREYIGYWVHIIFEIRFWRRRVMTGKNNKLTHTHTKKTQR